MATTIGIYGPSGSGKTTSLENLDPDSTFLFNADGKDLSFRGWKKIYFAGRKPSNYMKTSSVEKIWNTILEINKGPRIKTIIIDTVNAIMTDDEIRRMGEKSYDKWQDLIVCIYDLVVNSNALRDDLTVVFMFHEETYLDEDGTRVSRLMTNGKKLAKIDLATKMTVMLKAVIRTGGEGNNEHFFETKSNKSIAKSPKGMFKDFEIPNDLQTVIEAVHEYNNEEEEK